eukprot:TRINITY_DN32764_c0_g1_i2.p1 TRINITY_DN32764_c0_g1~~TRINITY_DN32764_c0_g1_i2.p1  ORF type:complete len:484 (+),score=160.80 TRINITY_DN32764_c0_g1_i2:83-1453(+)
MLEFPATIGDWVSAAGSLLEYFREKVALQATLDRIRETAALQAAIERFREGAAQELSIAVLAAGGVGLATNALYVCIYTAVRRKRMRRAFLQNHRCQRDCSSPRARSCPCSDRIPTPEADQLVLRVLESGEFGYVITGECGCGKSEVLRRALERFHGPHVYVSVRSETDCGGLVTQIAEAVDFRFDERISWLDKVAERVLGEDPSARSEERDSDFRRLSSAVEWAAQDVKLHRGGPAVLVIDNLQRLVDEEGVEAGNPCMGVHRIADWAAACADDRGALRIVFALPHGPELQQLLRRRCLSRLQIFDLPPVQHRLATDWTARHLGAGQDRAAADRFVRTVGGLPLALQRARDSHICMGLSLAQVQDEWRTYGVDILQQWDLLTLSRDSGEEGIAGPVKAEVWQFLVRLIDADLDPALHGADESTKVGISACSLSKMSAGRPKGGRGRLKQQRWSES